MSGLFDRLRPYPRRDRSAEAPRRLRGVYFECTRCGDHDRMPTDQFWSMCAPALCRSCVADDAREATLRRPRAPMVQHDYEYAKWVADPVPVVARPFIITGTAVEDIFDEG